jgi:hypothetical protein
MEIELKTTGQQHPKGGQYAGTRPQTMRVECTQDGTTIVAVEMLIRSGASQHKARNAAIAVIEMLLAELREPPLPASTLP